MNNSFLRYHTYPVGRANGSRRLSSTLGSNWLSVREGYVNDTGGVKDMEDAAVCPPEGTDTDMEPVLAANIQTTVERVAAVETDPATETVREEAAAETEIKAEVPAEILAQPAAGLSAYGCVYHKGAQRLVIAHPGDAVPIPFAAHSCLNRIGHNAGDAYAEVADAGDYEIAFDLRISANASAPVALELRAGDQPIPGGTYLFALSSGIREYRGGTMAQLQAGDRIGLVLTSASVCEASLSACGVSAMLSLKKLN